MVIPWHYNKCAAEWSHMSFFPVTVIPWNRLPASAVTTSSLDSFKAKMLEAVCRSCLHHVLSIFIYNWLLHDAYTPHCLLVHLCLRRKTSIGRRRRRRRRNPIKILAVYKKCLKLISLKLIVRSTFLALKLQIFCQDSWQYVDEHPYVYKIVFKFICIHGCWLKQLLSPNLNSTSLVHERAFTYILSWVLAKWYLQF